MKLCTLCNQTSWYDIIRSMGLRIISTIILILILPSAAFCAIIGWTPEAGLNAGYYGAVPLAPYLKTAVPVRTQAALKLDLDLVCFTFNRFKLESGMYFQWISPSLSYDQSRLKGFFGIGARAAASYQLSSVFALGLGLEIGANYYRRDTKFGSFAGIIFGDFLVLRKPYFDMYITAPLNVSYRKDVVSFSLSIGAKFRFKGYWILEDDL